MQTIYVTTVDVLANQIPYLLMSLLQRWAKRIVRWWKYACSNAKITDLGLPGPLLPCSPRHDKSTYRSRPVHLAGFLWASKSSHSTRSWPRSNTPCLPEWKSRRLSGAPCCRYQSPWSKPTTIRRSVRVRLCTVFIGFHRNLTAPAWFVSISSSLDQERNHVSTTVVDRLVQWRLLHEIR